jgi:hypothetical protein
MRILVTEEGKNEIKSLSISYSNRNNNFNNNNNRNLLRKLKSRNGTLNNNIIHSKINSYNNLTNQQNFTKISIKKPRTSTINKISRIYDENLIKNNNNININTINHTLKNKSLDLNNYQYKNYSKNKNPSLYNIINKKAFNNMINKLWNEQKIIDKNETIFSFKFRNNVSPIDKKVLIKSLEKKCKNFKIKKENRIFINYLNNKKEINPIMLNNITKYSKEKIEKENKICKIILNLKGKIENKINNKIESKKRYDKIYCNKNIKKLGNKINDSYCLINKYPMAEERKNKEKLIYLEKLNIFKRTYWNNEHINNLYLKKVNNNETNSISIEK